MGAREIINISDLFSDEAQVKDKLEAVFVNIKKHQKEKLEEHIDELERKHGHEISSGENTSMENSHVKRRERNRGFLCRRKKNGKKF